MLLPAPPLFPRKRKPRPKPRPLSSLTITSVEITTASTQLKITFSAAITWNGTDVPTEFKCVTSDGLDQPINVLSTGSDWIEVEFNGSVVVGAAWQVDGLMSGISPDVAWPQNGTVAA